MHAHSPRPWRVGALALLALTAPSTAAPKGPGVTTDLIRALEFRSIGPAIMGGRIDDFAVVESNPSVFYVGTASGGVLKTTNGGITFEPVFDGEAVSTIGDLVLAPSDPQILYVGTGEPNNRQSSSWGRGVYKTLDGGKTWTHLGLADTHHIGRIVVHPSNPDIAYVAALGHLWGPNKERGLFKSVDGGKTWTNAKFIDEDTGFVDVALDRESPQTLYAASYQRRRTPFGYNGGGPGSALWKTVDGGATWKKLTGGLPKEGDIGRIGVSVYRKDPRVVYALIEHAKEGGIYRSDDRGETWNKMSSTNPRPSYYSQVHIDPGNDQRIWVLGAPVSFSEDGGKTFRQDLGQRIHGDYHALWIEPSNSDHMITGTDGGIHVSYDRGRSWDFVNTVPLGQFYEVHADMRKPYWVCGGLQDNGSWCGPSRTLVTQGITNDDWYRVGGGDGFYNAIDPTDPNIIYTESQDGNVQRFDARTNERRQIRPEPPEGQKYRFNWNSPLLISPHDPRTIYYGGNRLFGSKDRGETWTLVTPDLTDNADRDRMPIFGKTAKDFLSRNDGVQHFGTITTIAESPRRAGILWIGTDDGNLQISRDAGVTWANVAGRVPGVPKGTYVSRVEASRTGDGAAYAAFDGHRGDDFKAYLFRTDDYGQTWRSVAGNLPAGGTVHVIREHTANPDLLFVGTEYGLWASWSRGQDWVQMKNKLPTVPVDDIYVHPRENDLILGTHGRSVYILDDITPFAQLSEAVLGADLHVFDIRPATEYRLYGNKGNTGNKYHLAPNPPDGALITYWLKLKPPETEGKKAEAKLTVKDSAGTVVRELKGPADAGLNRTSWDMRDEPPVPPQPGGGGGGGPSRGPLVPPGSYMVTVSVGSWSASKPALVDEDPRIRTSEADRNAWYQALREAAGLWKRADAANRAAESLKNQVEDLQQSLKKNPAVAESVPAAVRALGEKVTSLAQRLSRQTPEGFAGAPLAGEPEPLLNQARGLYSTLGAITAPPTTQQRDLLASTARQLAAVVAAINALVETDVPALNKLMFEGGLGKLDGGTKVP